MTISDQWRAALSALTVRHPNGWSKVVLRVSDGDPPVLYVGLDATACTSDGHTMSEFAISNVALTYWPGEKLARQWFAAAFAGYCTHEALELVTLDGRAVLDPHQQPYATCPQNRGLRDGFPVQLTPNTLAKTLALVMPWQDAAEMADETAQGLQ
jgi:hypothetical protein